MRMAAQARQEVRKAHYGQGGGQSAFTFKEAQRQVRSGFPAPHFWAAFAMMD